MESQQGVPNTHFNAFVYTYWGDKHIDTQTQTYLLCYAVTIRTF